MDKGVRYLFFLLAAYAGAACSDSPDSPGTNAGQGGSGASANGGTGGEPNGQGGSNNLGGAGGSGSGGTAGSGGMAGSGGTAGSAAGMAGAGACEAACDSCYEGEFLAECGDLACVCEVNGSPNKGDHTTLLACEFEEPCDKSTLMSDPGSTEWRNGECLLSALRDRTEGRYFFSSTFADLGSMTTHYTLLVTGNDGEVLVLTSTEHSLAVGNIHRTYATVTRCGLKSYDHLEACLAAGTDVSITTTGGAEAEAVCESITDWVEDCESLVDPVCP